MQRLSIANTSTPRCMRKACAEIVTIRKAARNWRPDARTLTENCTRVKNVKHATFSSTSGFLLLKRGSKRFKNKSDVDTKFLIKLFETYLSYK